MHFPGGSAGKESVCNTEDLDMIPRLGRSHGGRHSNPLQYSCLESPHVQRSLVGYNPCGRKEPDNQHRLKYTCGCLVTKSCPPNGDPMDCSQTGSSGHDFPRQECWSGLSFPSPGQLPNPGIEVVSPALQVDSLLTELPGKPKIYMCIYINHIIHI